MEDLYSVIACWSEEAKEDNEKLRESIEALQHTIAGAAVVITAGIIYAAAATKSPEFNINDAAQLAQHLVRVVGNGE